MTTETTKPIRLPVERHTGSVLRIDLGRDGFSLGVDGTLVWQDRKAVTLDELGEAVKEIYAGSWRTWANARLVELEDALDVAKEAEREVTTKREDVEAMRDEFLRQVEVARECERNGEAKQLSDDEMLRRARQAEPDAELSAQSNA